MTYQTQLIPLPPGAMRFFEADRDSWAYQEGRLSRLLGLSCAPHGDPIDRQDWREGYASPDDEFWTEIYLEQDGLLGEP